MLRSGFGKGKAGEDRIQLKFEAKTKGEEE